MVELAIAKTYRMAYTRPSAFHLQNILSWLSVPLLGIVLQMLVFFILYSVFSNYEGVELCVVTVLLEYLTDCSIRVSQSCIIVTFLFFLGGGGGGEGSHTCPCAP